MVSGGEEDVHEEQSTFLQGGERSFERWDDHRIKLRKHDFMRFKDAVVLWAMHPRERDARLHRLLVALVSAYRYEGEKVKDKAAKLEAKTLAHAFKHSDDKTSLVEDDEFIRILASRSEFHLLAVYKHYREITGSTIDEDLGASVSLQETVQCLCPLRIFQQDASVDF